MRGEGEWVFDQDEEDVVHGYGSGEPEGSEGDGFAAGV